jgi:hypothetical protein
MRPGHKTVYPFSPYPHHSCRRTLDTVSIYTISFNIVMLPAKLAIIYRNIFTFFICYKKHLSFGLVVAMWALSLPPPLHTRYCYEELQAPG